MRRLFLRITVVAVLMVTITGQSSAQETESAPVVYTIVDLGPIVHTDQDACYGVSPGATVTDVAVGDRAVGAVYLEGERAVATLFSSEGPRMMVSGPGGGVANAINGDGEIAGAIYEQLPVETCGEASSPNPVVWNADFRSTPLDMPDGAIGGVATAINSAGQIVGWVETEAGRRAALWTDDGVILSQHAIIEGVEDLESEAVGINDDGIIAGTLRWTSDGNERSSAFVWDGEQIRYLTPDPGLDGYATAINNAGAISGAVIDESGTKIAVLWWQGEVIELGPLDDRPHAVATDVNNAGFAVGYGEREDGLTRAMVWIDESPFDLNEITSQAGSWLLQMAVGINDDGVIAGWGDNDGERHALLLVPAAG